MPYKGLSTKQAAKILKKDGLNQIKKKKQESPFKILLSQFTSPLIIILIIAAVISLVIGFLPNTDPNIIDAVLILIIVLISGISGFFQEYKAEKSIEALQKMATPKAKVLRDGKIKEIPSTKLAQNDIIFLESGDIIPADAKIIESHNLKVDESSLTGESRAVSKKGEEKIYMNTFVYIGRAKARIINTGMSTKIGKIADKLQDIKKNKTLFEKEISKFSKKIFWLVGVITVIIFLISLFKYSLYISVLTAISLAVASIPEGLPAIVVLTLAFGAKLMVKKKALIRKLGVAESIGSVNIICTDKTGTITKNEMTVTDLFMASKIYKADKLNVNDIKPLKPMLVCGVLCNDTKKQKNKSKEKKYIGDETEVALYRAADKIVDTAKILEKNKRINEIPFTADRKMMSVVVKNLNNPDYTVYTKGAPEILIKKCKKYYKNGKIIPLKKEIKQEILARNKEFANQALRVLGFAYKKTKDPKNKLESELIWLGLQAMEDPPHPEIKSVLKKCKTAGIRVIMVTGDNPNTAVAIADKIGLTSQGLIEGHELEKMDKNILQKKLDQGINIFARINPFHKMRILKILEKDNRVAMTGDGVNDSLALKQAHVGIAMGINGTEIAKETSDMILLDDNFKTIVTAIKEGRKIFDNIRKAINYLLVCNLAEVGVILLATLFITTKEPVLLPVQILWINLLTDGLPALALAVDPARPDIMKEKPRKAHESIINKTLAWLIGSIGLKKMIILFATFFILLPRGLEVARTALFTGFIIYEFIRIASIRYREKLNWLSNKWLLLALVFSFLLQIIIIYSPLNSFFHVTALGLYEWLVILIGAVFGYFSALGITKIVIKYVKN
ncbi:MAG: cation-translocating P-type ATPase [Patescibacteria group bacterium]|nr:cation-translocating P-type ATPase [Patescibacteria group bacterium]